MRPIAGIALFSAIVVTATVALAEPNGAVTVQVPPYPTFVEISGPAADILLNSLKHLGPDATATSYGGEVYISRDGLLQCEVIYLRPDGSSSICSLFIEHDRLSREFLIYSTD